MSKGKYSIGKDLIRKKVAIVVFSIVVFSLVSISLGYILPITSNVYAQQNDVCDEDDPPPPPDGCPCNDCVNGCGGGCTDVDGDDSDNCVGYESVEYEEACFTICEGAEDRYGNCPPAQTSTECEIVGMYETCIPY